MTIRVETESRMVVDVGPSHSNEENMCFTYGTNSERVRGAIRILLLPNGRNPTPSTTLGTLEVPSPSPLFCRQGA